MPDLAKGRATICVVNYKTLDFTRLCLRSIRKFTKYPYEVIVIDNDSRDGSLEYLKSLEWIRLLERNTETDQSGGYSHAAAIDLGLENCDTEFFVSMHSDTFIQRNNWLSELIGFFSDDEVVCVGSGKIELKPRWQVLLKKATDFRTFKRRLLRVPDPVGHFRYYNRTICCLYRTEILRMEGLSFLMGRERRLTAGKKLYFELVDRGYKTIELRPSIMGKYVVHLAHATQAINPQEFTLRSKTVRKYGRLASKVMSSQVTKSILADDSLDS